MNQTSSTLQNVSLELSTVGDLRLNEKPQAVVIPPGQTASMVASIRVSSTDTGVIFGSITYDVAGAAVTYLNADRNCVVLNEIKIDIMDYISPATCSELKFRQMWAEFEWENKISVSTDEPDVLSYLNRVLAATNMRCLAPKTSLDGECGFLTANLYARSLFGEDVLANVSVESEGADLVSGLVRIRAKTQGIALAIGEKIQMVQRRQSSEKKTNEKNEKAVETQKSEQVVESSEKSDD